MSADAFPGFSRRRKLLIALLAVTTALTVAWSLLERPGGLHGPRALPASPPACSASQTQDCVGGRTAVIVPVPAPVPAPAQATASAPGR